MTAVEWFAKQVLRSRQLGFISNEKFNDLLEQAKAMDKEKLKDAYDAGVWDVGCRAVNFDEYYKRTFKSE